MIKPLNIILNDIVLLTAAASFGIVVGRGIYNIPSLISFAIAASICDILSFTLGSTHKLIETAKRSGWDSNNIINHLSFTIHINGRILPIIGIGDFIIIGIFFIALNQMNLPKITQFTLPVVGLLFAIAIGLIAGGIFAIPFISLPVLSYLVWKRQKLLQGSKIL